MAAETKTDVQCSMSEPEDNVKVLKRRKSAISRQIDILDHELRETTDPDVRRVKRDHLKAQMKEFIDIDKLLSANQTVEVTVTYENRDMRSMVIFLICLFLLPVLVFFAL